MVNFGAIKGAAGKFSKTAFSALSKKSPTILAATSWACLVGSLVTLWNSKGKIDKEIEDYKETVENIYEDYKDPEDKEDKEEKLKEAKIECAKKCIKHAAPTVLLVAIGSGSLFASVRTGNKRNAALAAALTFAEKKYDDTIDESKRQLGNSKTEKIEKAVMKRHLDDVEMPVLTAIQETGTGDIIFWDEKSGTWFKASYEYVNGCISKLNEDVGKLDWVSVYDFFTRYLGVDCGTINKEYGWNYGYNPITGMTINPMFKEVNGTTYVVVMISYDWFLREQY